MRGELEIAVIFPGLSCEMLLVVASIGSDGLLGTEALQSCFPHQLDLRTGQLWVEGRSTLQLHQQRLTPRAAAYLTTSVVLPPDRGGGACVRPVCIGHPARTVLHGGTRMDLTEDYGVIVGHTLVDAFNIMVGQCPDGEP